MKVKAWVIARGLAVCLFTQTAVAENCKTYELSGSNNRATLAATNFTIANDGPEAVVIETGGDQSLHAVIEPTKKDEANIFAGDARFTYFIRLAKVGGKAKAIVCSLAGELEDATAAYDRSDYTTALRLLQPLAKKGDVAAQTYLGLMYERGLGVSQDYTKAVKWYRLAANHGYANAQSNLGGMYDDGKGVPQDYTKALKWQRKAAEQSYAAAQSNLGVKYANGLGVKKDNVEARKWYRLAAEQGVAEAQFNLGNSYYYKHEGVTQDYAEAMKWYRLAADQRDASAQQNLAIMYAVGEGVSQDYVQAHMWFSLAAAGFPASSPKLRDLAVGGRDLAAKQMTPAQIADAQRLAQEWLAAHPKK